MLSVCFRCSHRACSCAPHVQVFSLDVAGFGLQGNLSEGRWSFFEDLPHMTFLSIIDNPGLVGDFPATMNEHILQIAATGTGMLLVLVEIGLVASGGRSVPT